MFFFVTEAACEAPEAGINTVNDNSGVSEVCGGEYNYTCITGYQTTDPLIAVCTVNGTWSIPPPECKGM